MEHTEAKNRQKRPKSRRLPLWVLPIPLFLYALLIYYLLQGRNVALFNPKGFIAQEQFNLMSFVVIVLLAIAVPSLSILYFTAWKYRETNMNVVHHPLTKKNRFPVLLMWLIPTTVALIIASAMWPATHRLAPQKSIASDEKPVTIQVVSLRWKWLFIYPEQQIATVNFIQIPINTPIRFELTADETPMSSFWIPNLGGQLYSMTSHDNLLNLMAETPGDYPGSSAEINGAGFAGMRFTARASSAQDFDEWIETVKRLPEVLDSAEYQNLLIPSESNPPKFYSYFKNNLYNEVLMKYNGHSDKHKEDEIDTENEHMDDFMNNDNMMMHNENETTEGQTHN